MSLDAFKKLYFGSDSITSEEKLQILKFAEFPEAINLYRWIKEWFVDCSNNDFKRFVFICTGNENYIRRTRITIEFYDFLGLEAFPKVSVCDMTLQLPLYTTIVSFLEKWKVFLDNAVGFTRI
jgi:hypothetical protein